MWYCGYVAFCILVVAVAFAVSAAAGIFAGSLLDDKGKIGPKPRCLATFAAVLCFVMFALSPVYISLFRWTAAVMKGI